MKLDEILRNAAKQNIDQLVPTTVTDINENSQVYYVGKETVVTISTGEWAVFGRSKLMCGDKYSKAVGQGIALGRAIKNLGEAIESEWLSRSITEEQYLTRRGKA